MVAVYRTVNIQKKFSYNNSDESDRFYPDYLDLILHNIAHTYCNKCIW